MVIRSTQTPLSLSGVARRQSWKAILGRGVAIVVTATVIAAGGAHAGIVTATYTGTLEFGEDDLGLFGAPGADLTGDPFTAVMTLNTLIPHAHGLYTPRTTTFFGGPDVGDPIDESAVLTVNGLSYDISGDYLGYVNQTLIIGSGMASEVSYASQSINYYATYVEVSSIQPSISSYDHNITSTSDIAIPFSYTAQPTDGSGYSFSVQRYPYPYDQTVYTGSDGYFDVTSLTVSYVPEPSAWVLALIGFGVMGATLRTRRRVSPMVGAASLG